MNTKSFAFTEPNGSVLGPESPFIINSNSKPLSVLYRVIGGTCNIHNIAEDTFVIAKNNYFYSDYMENIDQSISFLEDIEETLTLEDYENMISKNRNRNVRFFASLLNEFTASIYYEIIGMHTASYVHIYRAYESMSFAFPMIYASKTDTYYGTFNNLKKWLCNSTNTGELKFHKNFILTLMANTPELMSTIDIYITAKDECKESIFDSLERKVLGWNRPSDRTAGTTYPDKISIPFGSFHSFIVTLRNRYFHYMSTREDNIHLSDIYNPEIVFSFVTKQSIYFMATLLNAVVMHQYK